LTAKAYPSPSTHQNLLSSFILQALAKTLTKAPALW
jgi:hypothetical protein